ncbi:ArsR family transcriptional regulator [Patescibacteria group bacterium]|nr:ArsR family transcriptional regulator [Patescibacteria group bacterium]
MGSQEENYFISWKRGIGFFSVKNIAKHFTLSRPTISHHLHLMKWSRLLVSRKDGQEVYYFFNTHYVKKFMKVINDSLNSCY